MTPAELLARWADLAAVPHRISGMDRRRLDAEVVVDIFACIFWPRGRAGLLIEGAGDASDVVERMPRCRGVRVEHELTSDDAGARTTLVVVLEQERLREIFAVLSVDLVNAITGERSAELAIRRCVERLCMWQGLFDRLAADGLSEERQRGLFGELVILERVFLTDDALLAAADAWTGSDSAPQDFVRGGLALEVKTTLAKRPARMMIANERQLDESPHDMLFLASVRLDESDAHGRSLSGIVTDLRRRFASDETAAQRFEDRLLAGDYLDVHASLYDARRYDVSGIRHFRVEGEFPRLTESRLPDGVGDIRYSIAADGLGAWEIDEDMVVAAAQRQP